MTGAGRRFRAARLVLCPWFGLSQLYPRIVLFFVRVMDIRAARRDCPSGQTYIFHPLGLRCARIQARAPAPSSRGRGRAFAQQLGERAAHAEKADDFAVLPQEQTRSLHIADRHRRARTPSCEAVRAPWTPLRRRRGARSQSRSRTAADEGVFLRRILHVGLF